ncbi:MAG: c-type cytochrome domain-containing protein, partial [Pirellulales bacterium]
MRYMRLYSWARPLLAVALVLSMLNAASADEAIPAPDYNTHVLPILQKYCSACHSADEAEGGLIVDDYEKLLAGGSRGRSVVPGRSDQSRLVLLLDGKAKPAMPPAGNDPPTADEIAVLKAWIDAGAKSPTGQAPDPTKLVTPSVALTAPPRLQVNALACSPDGTLLALAGYAHVKLVSLADGATVREWNDPRGNVTAISFSADGSQLIAACGEPGLFGEARVWNVADGSLLKTIVGHRDSLYGAALSPDGTTLATGGYDEAIKLWNAADGTELRNVVGHNGAVYDVAFRPDGKILASASADRTVKLWEVATGERLETLGQSLKELYTLAWSPDGQRIAAAGVDNRIRVWQISADGREGTNPILYARFAHQGPVIRLAWSPDGQTLASASEDRTLKLWDAASMTERKQLETQPDWPSALAFTSDSQTLAVGRLDGSWGLYSAATGQPLSRPEKQAARRKARSRLLSLALKNLPGLSLLALADEAPAAPQLTSLSPRGIERGTATKVRLIGTNLAGATEVKSNNPLLTVKLVPPTEQPSELSIEATAAADLPTGVYEVGVVTPGGASGMLKLYVDNLPQAVESEPNDLPVSAGALVLPIGVWGGFDKAGDTDRFTFDAYSGQTVVFDLAAATIGSKANAVITLLDGNGKVLATSNDFDGQPDPLLAYTFAADGRYTVEASELALGASPEHFYRLTMGELPYVTGCFPLGVTANTRTSIELTGFNLPPDARAVVVAGAAGEASVSLHADLYRSRRDLRVTVNPAVELLEAEPNNLPRFATAMTVPGVANGRLHAPRSAAADVDLYRFDAQAGQTWVVETEAARRGSPVDTRLEILHADGRPVERLWLQAVRDSYVTFRGIDSNTADVRLKSLEEMGLNQWVYQQGEVGKIFRMPQGPDSGVQLYTSNGKRRCYFDTSPTVHAL